MNHNLTGINIYATMGASLSAIVLLSRWITGTTFFIAPEATLRYGLVAGFSYSLIGSLTIFAFIFPASTIQRQCSNKCTLSTFLENKYTDKKGYRLHQWIMFFVGLTSLYIQVDAGAMLFYAIFHLPLQYGVLLFSVIGLLFYFAVKTPLSIRHHIYKVASVLLLLVVLMVYFFILKGVEHIYEGVRLYHPYLFVINNQELPYFLLAIFFIFLSQFFLDPTTWDQLPKIEQRKLKQTFILTGFIWGTIPLSFFTLIFAVIYTGGFQNVYTIYYDLFQSISSPILFTFVILFLLGAIISTFIIQISSMVNHFEPQKKLVTIKNTLFGFLFILSMFYVTKAFQPTVFQLYFWFGIIYASSLLPNLWLLFWKGKIGSEVPVIWLMSIFTGFFSKLFYSDNISIIISVATSGALLLTLYGHRKFLKRGEINEA